MATNATPLISTLDASPPSPAGAPVASVADTLKAETAHDTFEFPKSSWWFWANRPFWLNSLLLVVLIGCGMLEGVAFQRSGIVDPDAIYNQMLFRVWIVMKMFISAVGVSMLVQGLLDLLAPTFFNNTRAARTVRPGIPRALVGGTLLGIGMSLSGTGPTILPAMLASNTSNQWITLLGCLAGGVAFIALDTLLLYRYPLCPFDASKNKLVVDERLGIRYYRLALPVGAAVLGLACALEWAVVPMSFDQARMLVPLRWPAVAAGAIIGANQLAFRFIGQHGQGGSTSFMVIISLLTCGKLSPKLFPSEWGRVWQLAFVWVGTSLGALASAQALGDAFVAAPGFTPWRCAVGGFLAILGSRISNGCTCGSGITGTSEFGLDALFTTAGIFGGAIATAFIINAAS